MCLAGMNLLDAFTTLAKIEPILVQWTEWSPCSKLPIFFFEQTTALKYGKLTKLITLTAPIIIRNISQRNPRIATKDVGVALGTDLIESRGHRNIARKQVSRIWDSQPKNMSEYTTIYHAKHNFELAVN